MKFIERKIFNTDDRHVGSEFTLDVTNGLDVTYSTYVGLEHTNVSAWCGNILLESKTVQINKARNEAVKMYRGLVKHRISKYHIVQKHKANVRIIDTVNGTECTLSKEAVGKLYRKLEML